jgi:type I restriction enzyme S subunit
VKAGWEVRPLGKVVKLNYGKAISKDVRSENGSVPVYGANGVMDYCDKPLHSKPSIIIGRKGSAGAINKADRPFWASDVSYYTTHDEARMDFNYLHFQLQYMDLPSMAKGVKPGINRDEVYALPIPLPPLDEQQRIVAILDEAFEGLARARAHAEANLQNARELFENSLLRVFDDLEANAPRLTLAEAATTFGRGKSRHRPRNAPILYGGDYPFVQTGDIRNSNGTVNAFTQTYSEQGLAQSKLWPAGTICITIAANIAETAVLGFDACFPDSIIGMVANPKITFPEYVEFMLRYFAAELKALGKGSAQDNINMATFEEATFPFPSISVQINVVEKLSQLAETTAQLATGYETKLQSLDALRQSLLQKAFAGELT